VQSPAQHKRLLSILTKNEWWLHRSQAKLICEKLALEFDEPAYYRNIFVWLPDVRWGAEAFPFCAGSRYQCWQCGQKVNEAVNLSFGNLGGANYV
jgi:hypothetical protein